jgi:flagellar hook protein FlgE
VTFNLQGALTTGNVTIPSASLDNIAGTAGTWSANGMTLDFGTAADPDRLTGFAQINSAAALSQNGSASGTITGFSVSQQGLITGVFSNGRTQAIGQLALAVFNNPAGLTKAGNSLYTESANSGQHHVGIPGTGGRGTLSGGTLEMSNVDLAAEFTNLIVAQRGFQANARVITTSDQILQDLVDLKR